MELEYLVEMNNARKALWHGENDPWTLADWGNAMGEECGEAQNVIKKMRRLELGMRQQRSPQTMEEFRKMLGDELADTILYALLTASAAGIDINVAIHDKFNEVSEREGFIQYQLWYSTEYQAQQLANLRAGRPPDTWNNTPPPPSTTDESFDDDIPF